MGNKLVVLGPVASVASDFQMVRHQLMPSTSRNADNPFPAAAHMPNLNNNNNNINNNMNHNHNNIPRQALLAQNAAQPHPSRNGSAEGGSHRRNGVRVNGVAERGEAGNHANNIEDDAVNRLQRNLQLRSRRPENDEYYLPKRFSDSMPPIHDRIPMAAFNVNHEPSPSSVSPRERRLESLRRMEEKIHAMRRVIQPQMDEPSLPPKRIKRNCIGMFVCDISRVLDDDEPCIEWVEYKNFGIISDAPERLILSSLVAGNGELIMFGGLRKESLNNPTSSTMQVSNSLHFLRVPREII